MHRYGGDTEVMKVLAKLTTFDMSLEQRRTIESMGASPDDLARSIYRCAKMYCLAALEYNPGALLGHAIHVKHESHAPIGHSV